MATEKQIQANRLNARKSTGPKTEQGKAVSRFNALRHGFRARTAVLPGEDPEQFAELCDSLEAEFQPEGVQETMLVELIALAWWRMARLGVTEQGIYANEHTCRSFAEKPFPEFIGIVFAIRENHFKVMSDIECRLERTYYRAIRELEKLQKARGRRQHNVPENPPQPAPVAGPEPAGPQPAPPPIAAKPVAFETARPEAAGPNIVKPEFFQAQPSQPSPTPLSHTCNSSPPPHRPPATAPSVPLWRDPLRLQ